MFSRILPPTFGKFALPAGRSESGNRLLLLLTFVCLAKLCHIAISVVSVETTTRDRMGRYATGVPLVAWDSISYLTIMTKGYPEANPRIPWVAGFFPLYPLSAIPFSLFLSSEVALILVANIASLLGFVVFFRWCEKTIGDSHVSFLAGMLLACYPPSFYFTASFSEGLFFLLTALCLLYCEERRFGIASIATGLATATRPTGVLLVPILVLMTLCDEPDGWQKMPSLFRAATLGIVASTGIAAFAAFGYAKYGDPLAYIKAQNTYGGGGAQASPSSPAENIEPVAAVPEPNSAWEDGTTSTGRLLHKITSPGAWNKGLTWGVLAMSCLALPFAFRRIPYPYLLLPLAIFALGYFPGHGVRINSIARFMTAALPMFLAMATWSRAFQRWVPVAVCTLGFLAQSLYAWVFSRGGWCG